MRIFHFALLILSLILVLPLAASSQKKTAEITETGEVLVESTRLPVEGASVSLPAGKQLSATNEQGSFSIKRNLHAGDTLMVTAIGYETKMISYEDFLKNNKIIFLKNKIIEMATVMVTLNPGEQDKLISKIDIRIRDINNSQEVLRLMPGLFIGQHAGGGKAEQIFLRGFDIDHGTDINIAVDGMPVNMVSHAHGQGYADLHFLIPETIENVSFKKGPYHAEKGNLATAGYIDFRTKDLLSSNLVKLEAGQFNTYRAVAMVNLLSQRMNKKEQRFYIASEHMYTRGYFDNPQNFNRLNIFGKYHGKIGDRNMLRLSASAFSSQWKASGQVPERALKSGLIGFFGAIDPNEGGNTGRFNVNAQLLTDPGNGNFIRNQVYYTHYDFKLYSNFTFFLKNAIDGDQVRQKEHWELVGYNGSYSHTSYVGDKKLTSEVGAGFRLDKTNDSELSRTKNRTTITEGIKLGDINELNTWVWLNETLRMTERLTINAGMRLDHFDVSYKDKLDYYKLGKANAGIISPKLNFYYQLNNKTQVYLATGRGFHSNDTRVVVQTGGKQILPAAYGADFGIILKPAPQLILQATTWCLKLDQEFVYVGDEGVVEPSSRSRRIGLDISARYQPLKWLFIDADANYSKGRATEEMKGENYLPLAPVFTSIGGITYKSSTGLNAALRYRYMGDRPANETNSVVAKGYFVTDAMTSYETKRFEVGISVQNLFDVRWKETQFDTESRLQNETVPISEIHFTAGSPFFFKTHISFFF